MRQSRHRIIIPSVVLSFCCLVVGSVASTNSDEQHALLSFAKQITNFEVRAASKPCCCTIVYASIKKCRQHFVSIFVLRREFIQTLTGTVGAEIVTHCALLNSSTPIRSCYVNQVTPTALTLQTSPGQASLAHELAMSYA